MKIEELENLGKPYHIFAEVLEPEAIVQFVDAMGLDSVVEGALMPDAHMGYTLPIGAVIAVKDVVYPSFVGYDIGCGCCALKTEFKIKDIKDNAKKIFDQIYRDIPVGFNHNQKNSVWNNIPECTNAAKEIFDKNGLKQLCSLGGGNHYIELGYDEQENVWITVHSGSRGIGHAIATHYMKLASGSDKAKEGAFGFDIGTKEGQDYIKDMNFCLEFALENRKQMVQRVVNSICHVLKIDWFYIDYMHLINRNHNHAEMKNGLMIHRKGATHAEEGMMGVIPGNMKDGSFIVRGKGNPNALWSSSHGAGRCMGRKKAERELSIDDFKTSMEGIMAKVGKDTLDESPMAYKNIFEVMKQQSDMVEVAAHIKPIINIKG